MRDAVGSIPTTSTFWRDRGKTYDELDQSTIAMSDVRRLASEVNGLFGDETAHDICEVQFLIDEVLQKVAEEGFY
ncbi:hypothetical protein RvY_15136 [Ramazzottius varieornatus]|uniref:Uncharacterized protein n=1 Tax=Ramazzottius varieornatus TaxID=947166 RepID=A0A1D1VVH1_RAMVA|nr:hypothetical protein RvY_15136 [Ramazzottius varieornatus]